jgi:hypothetical protein
MKAPFSKSQAEFEVIKDHYANLFDAGRPSEDNHGEFLVEILGPVIRKRIIQVPTIFEILT